MTIQLPNSTPSSNPLLRVSEEQMVRDNLSAFNSNALPMSDSAVFRFPDGTTGQENAVPLTGVPSVATSINNPVVQPPSVNSVNSLGQPTDAFGALFQNQTAAQLKDNLNFQSNIVSNPNDPRHVSSSVVSPTVDSLDALYAKQAQPTTKFGQDPSSVPNPVNTAIDFNNVNGAAGDAGVLARLQQAGQNQADKIPAPTGTQSQSLLLPQTAPFDELAQATEDPNKKTTDGNPITLQDGLELGFSGLKALSGLFNAYQGYKALGIAEDQFDFNKSVTRTNLANQANLTNEALADRQRRRFAEGSSRTTAEQYVQKHGVSGIA